MKRPPNDLSDRERIWLHLLARLAVVSPLMDHGGNNGKYEHFRFSKRGEEPRAGQIVVAMTSAYKSPHPHVVGECVGRGDPGPGYAERDVPLIRAFGEPPENAIFFFSESFYIYTGDTTGAVFFEGWKRDYYLRLRRAMPKAGDTYWYRYAGLKFLDDGLAELTVRAHIFLEGKENFTITLPATPKTLMRDMIHALKDGGFGTRFGI